VASLGLALMSVALLLVRWAVAPPRPVTLDLGAPTLSTSHFYAPEEADGVGFRWSRTASALSLPALGTSQVISVTLNPARPPDTPPAHFRLSLGAQTLGSYEAQPGWTTYTTTVGPGLGPDLRLILDSETFYPGPGDRRKLGMAVAEVATAPREGRAGLRLPPYLWLLSAILVPLSATVLGTRRSLYYGMVAGVCAALLPTIASLLLPTAISLPAMAWLAGIAAALLLLYYALRITGAYPRPLPTGEIITPGEGEHVGSTLQPNDPNDPGENNPKSKIQNPKWQELGLVALFMSLLAILFTWPLAARIGSSMPGWPADNFAFLYKLWWFRTALIERGQWPLFDPNSYAPFGFDLGQGEPTLANTIPGVVIGTLTNDVVSYNILVLLSFVVSGLGAYLLVRELTGNRGAALLAGVAFAVCPYRMAQVAGHLQLVGTGWIALSFYFLERTLKTRSIRDSALLGLMLSLTALSAWYYAYMVGLALALYAAIRLWQTVDGRRWTGDSKPPATVYRLPSFVKPFAASALVFLLLGGVAAIPSLRLWAQGMLTHSAKAADEHSASPLDYAIPNQLHPLWGEAYMRAHAQQNIIESNLYLGAIAVAIIAAGWVVRRRAGLPSIRAASAWLTLLIVTGILSLGLTLHGLEGQVQFPFGPLPLPGRLLFDWLPFYSSMRAYARFGVLVTLAVAILLGIGWAYIMRARAKSSNLRFHPRQFTLVALLLLLIDLWTSPYSWGTSRVEPTETARFLAAQPQPGLVMQMPLTASQSGPLLFQETYYSPGKPIAYGYDTFEPQPWREARPALEAFPDDASLDVLHGWGVRYIAVSANAYGADWPGTLDFLRSLPRLRLLQTVQEARTWEVDPAVLDAQPELLQYFEPDTQAVFELVR
jgi:hypothetical protein